MISPILLLSGVTVHIGHNGHVAMATINYWTIDENNGLWSGRTKWQKRQRMTNDTESRKSIGRRVQLFGFFRRVWETKDSLVVQRHTEKKKKPENVEINWLRDVYVYLML